MTATDSTTAPFHLAGNYAPVATEVSAFDLPVTGDLPAELHGSFLRNGPNPHSGSSPHWFFGDGMVHGIRLEQGQARWYRNRYVETTSLRDGATIFDAGGSRDFAAGKANTHVVRHAGRILALDESSFPYEMTAELETLGPYDFGGQLRTAMTAHPKICPATEEMYFFGYGFTPPYLTYHVADAAGQLVVSREVDVPGSTMMHDFNLTERFVIFMDLPAVFDLDRALAGTMPYRFDTTYGARLGVLRRDDPHGNVRWFEVDPCYVFHPVNAHDDGRTITIDVVRYREVWAQGDNPATLWRWAIDLAAGTVTESQLDDRPCEFPRVDDRQISLPARRGWVTTMPSRDTRHGNGALTVYDLETGGATTHELDPGRVPSEAVFAPADDQPGGPGWLLAYVYDAGSDTSDLVILDIDDVEAAPVATVHLPARVPYGFHGSWLAD